MRAIVILDQVDVGDRLGFRVAFRMTVPLARQRFYANADATSAWLDASAEEIADLRAGKITEIIEEPAYPKPITLANARDRLVTRHGELQAEVNAKNPWARYGSYYDSTLAQWVPGSVA